MRITRADVSRRRFLQGTATVAAGARLLRGAEQGVCIVLDPEDPAATGPVRWAAGELERSLTARGVAVSRHEKITEVEAGRLCVLAGGRTSNAIAPFLKKAKVSLAPVNEAVALLSTKIGNMPATLACGYGAAGATYALLELSDRVQNAPSPTQGLLLDKPMVETPANAVRSVARLFTSDVEDKPWYNDREMWPHYLTLLASQRFNRFHLAFGIGYDFIRQVTDAYFLFAYPFLLAVPGYNVRAVNLPDAERDSNLEMLRYISEQTVARGMEFQLGLWMHGYEWIDSPHPNYTIEGLSAANHGAYSRDAVRLLLQKCPAISGVTFRVHGESGVQEGSYAFWKSVFEGVRTCGRPVRLDMHSKGMDQSMLDTAVATGLEVTLSPKFWAEHMGMPYHQTDIRELEQPHLHKSSSALMSLSDGTRSFLRYGYGDLLREDRPWKVIHRVWPGTQRLLLWGDPVTAKAYAEAFRFCGSDGAEICEPLSFKGRRGSGIAGDRCAYADATLRPHWDWQKYEPTYRIWGRLLYSPDTPPEVWGRYWNREFGPGGKPLAEALANASRILPIVTTAHGASAANNNYWPEIYTNQSMVDAEHYRPYSDSPAPRVFGNVSPFDPQLFFRMNDYADELLSGKVEGKYSPIEVAQWIEDYAAAAVTHLAEAEAQTNDNTRAAFRRAAIDISIQAGLGRFFGAKFRSGVLYRIYEQTGDPAALRECLNQYRKARQAWAELADKAKGVYMADITVGENPQLRGHWADRLQAIDHDIELVAAKRGEGKGKSGSPAQETIATAHGRPKRAEVRVVHKPPAAFRAGQELPIEIGLADDGATVQLYYRHVNQAERYQTTKMAASQRGFQATIPSTYTSSPYPIAYYFEVKTAGGESSLYPGLSSQLTQQPYFVLRQQGAKRAYHSASGSEV